LGITSYQDSQQRIDTFARISVPGTVTMQVDEPGQQVVYYEGDRSVGLDDMVVSVVEPLGSTVAIAPYEGELIYETTDLTLGRAIASFDAAQIGDYEIEVTGIDTGHVTVGESFSRLALPGVLAGLAVAGFSFVAGCVLWLFSILRR
jgi:murein endopeptidase